ncbi:MAG TPA: leucine--tRNA ligase [Candidatus Dormibacteraeota bacterium]|nr:leucine--tRNA ligase [Candidatus Dormibacteraeota bacterium]
MTSPYDHRSLEAKWQARWQETGLYRVDLARAPRPYYNLMMFPYPSAEGLHVGNMFSFSGADVHGRYERMRGFDVFEPIGFDAFGIHSENFALKVGRHPSELIATNVARFREQLEKLGAQFDWSKTVDTTDPAYYRWTQWLFLTLWKGGFAYRARRNVKWCPQDLTVLADEQVLADGSCERCGAQVTERELQQWFLRISAFTDRLLENLDSLNWSENTKLLQRHWIGRSQGALIDFPIPGDDPIRVFSTRPDTIFGATFMVLAPDHPRTLELASPAARPEVAVFLEEAARRRIAGQRSDEGSTRGVALGRDAIHPLTGAALPIFTADYVLSGYGTGAIMAVPAHDQRDHGFALEHHLPAVEVVTGKEGPGTHGGAGVLINSSQFNGLKSPDPAREVITAALVEAGSGQAHVTYKLRDWGISRQRYWGPPIPAIHCHSCGVVPVPEQDLPVLLPYIEDFRPLGTGESPLARDPDFLHTTCPQCGGEARRDTDVSDTFLDSSWYYLRYPSADRDDVPFDPELTRKWLPVTYYDGGNEHAVLHLLYSRFVTMALEQLGYLDFSEPFTEFRAHGMIVMSGAKMSKSRGNVVVPDEYIARFGADAFRLYLLYLGPYPETLNFVDSGINGPYRFIIQVLRLLEQLEARSGTATAESAELARARHRCIQQVTVDTPERKYNTAIAAMMIFVKRLREDGGPVPKEALETLALLLAPYCPHLAEEIWERLGGPYSVHQQPWPTADESLIADEEVVVVVCINGKKRDQLVVAAGTDSSTLEGLALELPRIQQWLEGRVPERVFVVPDRQVNLVLTD